MSNFKLTMEQWAIRDKVTGGFLPRRRTGNGNSHSMPLPAGGKYGPRMFHSPRAAATALRCWLKGDWSTPHTYTSYFGEVDWEESMPPKTPPVNRAESDMEIVRFTLKED
jgi:hypothetical protein